MTIDKKSNAQKIKERNLLHHNNPVQGSCRNINVVDAGASTADNFKVFPGFDYICSDFCR